MEEKDFAEKVLAVIKNNLFEIKKLFFNLDDCVSKKSFDELQEKFETEKNSAEKLQENKTRLENEISNKNSELADLLRQNSDMQNKIENLREEVERHENSLRQKKSEIEELLKSVEEKKSLLAEKTALLAEYAENYSELEEAYNSYKKLSDNTKFELEGVFGAGDSPTNFLAGALYENHLESLFDYLATAINNGENQNEIEILHKLFDFAFNANNNGRREKIYSRLNIAEGFDFDGEEMRKTSNSSQSGTVKNILLVGYKFSRTDKIIRKSLVFID